MRVHAIQPDSESFRACFWWPGLHIPPWHASQPGSQIMRAAAGRRCGLRDLAERAAGGVEDSSQVAGISLRTWVGWTWARIRTCLGACRRARPKRRNLKSVQVSIIHPSQLAYLCEFIRSNRTRSLSEHVSGGPGSTFRLGTLRNLVPKSCVLLRGALRTARLG